MTDKQSTAESTDQQCREKVFFPIGEVAKELGVEQYVLRFWESKFPQINPMKRRGRRLYDRGDIEVIKKIKHMLYDLGYTIKGAQMELKKQTSADKVVPRGPSRELGGLLEDLMGMRELLIKTLNGM
ncbi:MerR family transcriptional regulator [Anaplasma platys]|uniref:MerR family transcriptional regulator n=1 Tax=Anaplasma platys TaxID=949 RepID=A0A858PX71_9RICK|nr:MerR family transcriptional regulator [Anaplasma platys]QJC27187.1 MerR family transcriptional regulator [Anaplasma platys]